MEKYKLALKELKKITIHDPENGCNQVFCKLHDSDHLGIDSQDENGYQHNCLACQLNDGNERILRFIDETDTSRDEEYCFTIFVLLLYLQVEKLHTIFKVLGITQDYVENNWKVLIEIRKWANFIKHPKGFLFTHHPIFIFENDDYNKNCDFKIIDYKFVTSFYNREDESKLRENLKQLCNKTKIIVLIPDPLRLTKEYAKVCEEFCNKIKDNPHFKEVLRTRSTCYDYE